MDFLLKEKLGRLDLDHLKQRDPRTEEAQRKLEELGKQTLALIEQASVDDSVERAGSDQRSRPGRGGPGALSRVLFEQATTAGADRPPRPPRPGQGGAGGLAGMTGDLRAALGGLQGAVEGAMTAGVTGGARAAAGAVEAALSGVLGAGLARNPRLAGQADQLQGLIRQQQQVLSQLAQDVGIAGSGEHTAVTEVTERLGAALETAGLGRPLTGAMPEGIDRITPERLAELLPRDLIPAEAHAAFGGASLDVDGTGLHLRGGLGGLGGSIDVDGDGVTARAEGTRSDGAASASAGVRAGWDGTIAAVVGLEAALGDWSTTFDGALGRDSGGLRADGSGSATMHGTNADVTVSGEAHRHDGEVSGRVGGAADTSVAGLPIGIAGTVDESGRGGLEGHGVARVLEPLLDPRGVAADPLGTLGRMVEAGREFAGPVLAAGARAAEPLINPVGVAARALEPVVDLGGRVVEPLVNTGERMIEPLVNTGERMIEPLVNTGERLADFGIDQGRRLVEPVIDLGTRALGPLVDAAGAAAGPLVGVVAPAAAVLDATARVATTALTPGAADPTAGAAPAPSVPAPTRSGAPASTPGAQATAPTTPAPAAREVPGPAPGPTPTVPASPAIASLPSAPAAAAGPTARAAAPTPTAAPTNTDVGGGPAVAPRAAAPTANQPARVAAPTAARPAALNTAPKQVNLAAPASAAPALDPKAGDQVLVQPGFQIQGQGQSSATPALDLPSGAAPTPAGGAAPAVVNERVAKPGALPAGPAAPKAKSQPAPAAPPIGAPVKQAAPKINTPADVTGPAPAATKVATPAGRGGSTVQRQGTEGFGQAQVPPAPRSPGGGGGPPADPSGLVQGNASTQSQQAKAAQQLEKQASEQAKVDTEATAAKRAQVSPLGNDLKAAAASAVGPTDGAMASAVARGAAAAAAAAAAVTQVETGSTQEVTRLGQRGDAQRTAVASAPPPADFAASSNFATPMVEAAKGALSNATNAFVAEATRMASAAKSRLTGAQAKATSFTSDGSYEAGVDESAAPYTEGEAQLAQARSVQPPAVNAAPSGNPGALSPSGKYPSREAAIAQIEGQLAAQAQAQGPGQFQQAASTLAGQASGKLGENKAQVQSTARQQIAQGKAEAQSKASQQPPVSDADLNPGPAATKARSDFAASVSGTVTPGYQAKRQDAISQFDGQKKAADSKLKAEHQAAQQAAQSKQKEARAKADKQVSDEQGKFDQKKQQSEREHDQKLRSEEQKTEQKRKDKEAELDADLAREQAKMKSDVAKAKADGQREVDGHLKAAEKGYSDEVKKGVDKARAEKDRVQREQDAREADKRAKEAEKREKEKENDGGGVGGFIKRNTVDRVADAINWLGDQISAIADAISAAWNTLTDFISSALEAAWNAAKSVFNSFVEMAWAALQSIGEMLKVLIDAAFKLVQSLVSAIAMVIAGIIEAFAAILKGWILLLQQALTLLVRTLQAAINLALDVFIQVAGFMLPQELANRLEQAAEGFRQAVNGFADTAVNGINQAADWATTQVDNLKNKAQDAVFAAADKVNAGLEAINPYVGALEAAVNTLKEAALAVVKFAGEMATKALAAVSELAASIVDLLPESWTKAFVDFWNGPWRSIIIVGLATIAAVAITVGTGGVGGPFAAMMLAGVIGGSITGAAYLGGEALARQGQIQLSENGQGVYVPGYGNVQIDPATGQPIPPEGMDPAKQAEFMEKFAWSASNLNFSRDAAGNVVYEAKSHEEIGIAAGIEGAKGFGEGFISAAAAAGGAGFGQAAGKLIGGKIASEASRRVVTAVVTEAVGGVFNVASNGLSQGWNAGFEAWERGEDPFKAARDAAIAGVTDPAVIVSSLVSVGVAPARAKLLEPLLESRIGSQVLRQGADVLVDTTVEQVGNVSGAFVSAYTTAIREGKSPSEAMTAARTAAAESISPENIALSLAMNTAGSIANRHAEGTGRAGDATAAVEPGKAPVVDPGGGSPTRPSGEAPSAGPTHAPTPDVAASAPRIDTTPGSTPDVAPTPTRSTPGADTTPTVRATPDAAPTVRATPDATPTVRATPEASPTRPIAEPAAAAPRTDVDPAAPRPLTALDPSLAAALDRPTAAAVEGAVAPRAVPKQDDSAAPVRPVETEAEVAARRQSALDEGAADRTRRDAEAAKLDAERGHSGIEVHSHFMGNVEVETFVMHAASAGARSSADSPLHPRATDVSAYEPLLRTINDLGEQRRSPTRVNEDGSKTVTGGAQPEFAHRIVDGEVQARRVSGDALELTDRTLMEIDGLKRRLDDPNVSPADKTRLRDEIDQKARTAIEKALRASDETDFNSAYEIRDQLIKKTFYQEDGPQVRKPNGEVDVEASAYANYARETLVRLAADDIRYTEQSNSAKKLDQRFSPEALAAARQSIANDPHLPPALKAKVAELQVQQLTMINTNRFGVRDVVTTDTQTDARVSAGQFKSEVDTLVRQIQTRQDVVGIDIAGAEHFSVDRVGQARFEYMYKRLLAEAEPGKPIVLRPHVGEGANDTTAGDLFRRDSRRVTGENGEPSHYARARDNIDSFLTALENVGHKPDSPVIVRFGHATHTTPEQAVRMQRLGIIAEVNLNSNVETGSLDQNPGGRDRTPRQAGDPVPAGRFDDHALPTLLFNDVPVILSTDAHSVMSTNMRREYAQARVMIEDVISGRQGVRISAEQARARGLDVPAGQDHAVLFYGDMTPAERARFNNGYQNLYSSAEDYHARRPKQDGGDGGPAPTGPDVDPTRPRDGDAARTERTPEGDLTPAAKESGFRSWLRDTFGGGARRVSDPDAPIAMDTHKGARTYEFNNAELFNRGAGHDNDIDIRDVGQGKVGDCYLMAHLAGIAHQRPDLIRQMVRQVGDNQYAVRLYDYDTGMPVEVIVSGALHGERSMLGLGRTKPVYADVRAGGGDAPELWVALVEKAIATRHGGYGAIEGGKGNGYRVMNELTGQKARTHAIHEFEDAHIQAQLKAHLQSGHSVYMSSRLTPVASDVAGNHAYTLREITPDGVYVLHNPWGTQHVEVDLATLRQNFDIFNVIHLDISPAAKGVAGQPGPQGPRVNVPEGHVRTDVDGTRLPPLKVIEVDGPPTNVDPVSVADLAVSSGGMRGGARKAAIAGEKALGWLLKNLEIDIDEEDGDGMSVGLNVQGLRYGRLFKHSALQNLAADLQLGVSANGLSVAGSTKFGGIGTGGGSVTVNPDGEVSARGTIEVKKGPVSGRIEVDVKREANGDITGNAVTVVRYNKDGVTGEVTTGAHLNANGQWTEDASVRGEIKRGGATVNVTGQVTRAADGTISSQAQGNASYTGGGLTVGASGQVARDGQGNVTAGGNGNATYTNGGLTVGATGQVARDAQGNVTSGGTGNATYTNGGLTVGATGQVARDGQGNVTAGGTGNATYSRDGVNAGATAKVDRDAEGNVTGGGTVNATIHRGGLDAGLSAVGNVDKDGELTGTGGANATYTHGSFTAGASGQAALAEGGQVTADGGVRAQYADGTTTAAIDLTGKRAADGTTTGHGTARLGAGKDGITGGVELEGDLDAQGRVSGHTDLAAGYNRNGLDVKGSASAKRDVDGSIISHQDGGATYTRDGINASTGVRRDVDADGNAVTQGHVAAAASRNGLNANVRADGKIDADGNATGEGKGTVAYTGHGVNASANANAKVDQHGEITGVGTGSARYSNGGLNAGVSIDGKHTADGSSGLTGTADARYTSGGFNAGGKAEAKIDDDGELTATGVADTRYTGHGINAGAKVEGARDAAGAITSGATGDAAYAGHGLNARVDAKAARAGDGTVTGDGKAVADFSNGPVRAHAELTGSHADGETTGAYDVDAVGGHYAHLREKGTLDRTGRKSKVSELEIGPQQVAARKKREDEDADGDEG